MATITEKQLGQTAPADTNAVSIYSPAASTTAIIKSIVVANTTGSAATFRIFLDDNGTTYDATTALFYDISLAANSSTILSVYWPMNVDAGNLAVRTGTANALTFTVFGLEITA